MNYLRTNSDLNWGTPSPGAFTALCTSLREPGLDTLGVVAGEPNLCWEDLGLSRSLFSSSAALWFPGSTALCISWLHIKLQSRSPQTFWNGGVVPILLVFGFSPPIPFPSGWTLGSPAKLFCPVVVYEGPCWLLCVIVLFSVPLQPCSVCCVSPVSAVDSSLVFLPEPIEQAISRPQGSCLFAHLLQSPALLLALGLAAAHVPSLWLDLFIAY